MSANVSSSTKNDLRWRRTERHIMMAFDEEIRQHQLRKISVTDLSAKAEISKNTFYLHYHDIYDLADSYLVVRAESIAKKFPDQSMFFEDPKAFFANVLQVLDEVEFRQLFMRLDNSMLSRQLVIQIVEQLKHTHPALIPVVQDGGEPAAAAFVFNGIMASILASPPDITEDMLASVLSELIQRVKYPKEGSEPTTIAM